MASMRGGCWCAAACARPACKGKRSRVCKLRKCKVACSRSFAFACTEPVDRLRLGRRVGIPYSAQNAWPMSRCAPMMSAAIWHQISIEKRLPARENCDFPPRCARHFPKENLTFTSKPRRRPEISKNVNKGEALFRGMHRPAGP